MPATTRILLFLLLLAPEGTLLAQTSPDAPANQSPAGDAAERPSWANASWGPSQGPVKVPPPLPRTDEKNVLMSFEESPSAGNEESNSLRPAAVSAPPLAGSSTLQNQQTTPSLSAPNRKSSLPLTLPGKSSARNSPHQAKGLPSPATILSSLGVVIGIFLVLAWILRRAAPRGLARLPDEAFEMLGRAPLAGKQHVHLLRCGNKLLLVSVTPAGTETLTEITDPQEVDRLAGLCRQGHPHSSTAAFRQVFAQLAPKRPSRKSLEESVYDTYDSSGIDLSGAMGWEQRNA